ncbi:hypothetical protein IWQ60_004678 [Tieghemiomyces parasiticus]|uniref:ABC transporter domain-containing protein n=1 Tax=Tieghemiomyces parasiticus TaxID=78921 RepID=A0A9W8ADU7_9FUNG|nr:hypothetical protein IWQ60_004678 [Tieghemiomyces parasiticus]
MRISEDTSSQSARMTDSPHVYQAVDVHPADDDASRGTPKMGSLPADRSGLVWSNLNYRVPTATKGLRRRAIEWRTLLDNVSGSVHPGEMVAIMGSSGAGKSTLLNSLAARLKDGKLDGAVAFNGKPRDPHLFKKQAVYVEQDDLMYPELTVRETIRYAAALKLPARGYSKAAKHARVEEVIKALRLDRCADTIIGDSYTRGVSGGERKRASIGVEFVTDPEFMFLDEATSGLDSNSALHVCQVVQDLCRDRQIGVLMTIHQPSSKILNLFDKIILLCRGQVIYSGPRAAALSYFESLGYHCGQHENPADFFMDLMTIDTITAEALSTSEARIEHLVQHYRAHGPGVSSSGEKATMHPISCSPNASTSFSPNASHAGMPNPSQRASALETTVAATPPATVDASDLPMATKTNWALSWYAEFGVLLARCWKAQIRAKFTIVAMAMRAIIMTLFLGFTYFQLDRDQPSIQNRIGLLFFVPIDLMFDAVMPRLLSFSLQADIMMRERSGGAYRVSSFYLAKLLTELPFILGFDIVYVTGIYFLSHLQYDAGRYFSFLGVCLLLATTAVSLGMAVGAVFRRLPLSQIMAPLIIVILLIFGGNLANSASITPVLSWIRFISPVFYSYHALALNEFRDLTFSCGSGDAEGQCLREGAKILSYYDLDGISIGLCVGLLCALLVAFNIIGYISLRYNFKPRMMWI